MNEIGQIVGLTVCGLAVLSVLFGVVAAFRMERPVRKPSAVAPSIRSELDQDPAWWDREFRALEKKQIPRDAASHAGHDIEEPIQFWSGGCAAKPWCLDCGVGIDVEIGREA